MTVNQIERAYRAWPVLTETARLKQTITYLDLANKLDIHHRVVRYVLGIIQDYCLEQHLPPLTILIVNSSGKPGAGFIAYSLDHFEEGLEEVWSFDWQKLENPFEFAKGGDSYTTLIKQLVGDPQTSSEVYSKVKSRGIKQIIFREALLKTYSWKCAFTGISFSNALEACHIIPWSQATEAQRLDVRNGILLNSFHHKLFDQGYMTINTEYEILYYDPKEAEGPYSDMDSLLTAKLHGKTMRLPHQIKKRPLPDYILEHHKLNEWNI